MKQGEPELGAERILRSASLRGLGKQQGPAAPNLVSVASAFFTPAALKGMSPIAWGIVSEA